MAPYLNNSNSIKYISCKILHSLGLTKNGTRILVTNEDMKFLSALLHPVGILPPGTLLQVGPLGVHTCVEENLAPSFYHINPIFSSETQHGNKPFGPSSPH